MPATAAGVEEVRSETALLLADSFRQFHPVLPDPLTRRNRKHAGKIDQEGNRDHPAESEDVIVGKHGFSEAVKHKYWRCNQQKNSVECRTAATDKHVERFARARLL